MDRLWEKKTSFIKLWVGAGISKFDGLCGPLRASMPNVQEHVGDVA